MRKLKLSVLILLNAMLFVIQSFGQTNYKIVPDSLTCITPQQDIFFITQSFTIKELNASLMLKNKTISILNDESKFLRFESAEKQTEINLHVSNENNLKADIEVLKKNNKKSERKLKIIKVFAVSTSIIAVIECVYIGISSSIP